MRNMLHFGMATSPVMHNPPHPGEFIFEVYLEPSGISVRTLAGKLGVTPSTAQRLLSGKCSCVWLLRTQVNTSSYKIGKQVCCYIL